MVLFAAPIVLSAALPYLLLTMPCRSSFVHINTYTYSNNIINKSESYPTIFTQHKTNVKIASHLHFSKISSIHCPPHQSLCHSCRSSTQPPHQPLRHSAGRVLNPGRRALQTTPTACTTSNCTDDLKASHKCQLLVPSAVGKDHCNLVHAPGAVQYPGCARPKSDRHGLLKESYSLQVVHALNCSCPYCSC
jgi:hypothetical protein